MRVAGWHIDGFGVFSDYASPELGDGLTVFTGPNEAGKSTLLAYIRGVLFGFPDKRRQHVPLYAPVRGGRHGGRLFVVGDDGRYVIEREAGAAKKAVVVTLPDGGLGSEDDLAHLLGNADATLFETVFAFTLRELQELASLTKSDAAERIFSAGLVGAGQSAQKVVADLGRLAGDIYKRQGRGGALRDALAELGQTESLLAQAREAATGYPRLAEQLGAADREVQERDGQASIVRDKIARLRSLQSLWPAWSELLEAEEELQATGDATIDQEALADLIADLTLHRERLGRLPSLSAAALQATTDLAARLADLGADWTSERLDALDVSLPTRDMVRDWERRLREADATTLEAQRRLQQAEDARNTLLARARTRGRTSDAPAPGSTAGGQSAARWALAAAATAGAVAGAVLIAAGSTPAGVAVLAAALFLGVAAVVHLRRAAHRAASDARRATARRRRPCRRERSSPGRRAGSRRPDHGAPHCPGRGGRPRPRVGRLEERERRPAALSPEGVIDFFAIVEQARGSQRALTTITTEQDQTERLIANWEQGARNVAAPDTEIARRTPGRACRAVGRRTAPARRAASQRGRPPQDTGQRRT